MYSCHYPSYYTGQENTLFKKIIQWWKNRDPLYRRNMYLEKTLPEKIRKQKPNHWLNLKKYGGTK